MKTTPLTAISIRNAQMSRLTMYRAMCGESWGFREVSEVEASRGPARRRAPFSHRLRSAATDYGFSEVNARSQLAFALLITPATLVDWMLAWSSQMYGIAAAVLVTMSSTFAQAWF